MSRSRSRSARKSSPRRSGRDDETCGVFIHKLPKKYREREIEDLIRDAGAKAVKVTLFTFPNGDSKVDS